MMAAAVTALIEAAAVLTAKLAAVTERVAAVYRRGRWLVSNVSDVRIMWNITPTSYRYLGEKYQHEERYARRMRPTQQTRPCTCAL
jgi:hypothetical protein